jgi:hypothetical protein
MNNPVEYSYSVMTHTRDFKRLEYILPRRTAGGETRAFSGTPGLLASSPLPGFPRPKWRICFTNLLADFQRSRRNPLPGWFDRQRVIGLRILR